MEAASGWKCGVIGLTGRYVGKADRPRVIASDDSKFERYAMQRDEIQDGLER
jgi:hypothetical protein